MRLVLRYVIAIVAGLALCGCVALSEQPAQPLPSPAEAGHWSQLPPSPLSARHQAAGAYLAGRFYVVGGWSSPVCPPTAGCTAPIEPALTDGAAFDPATGRWEKIAPSPTPVGDVLEMTAAAGKLYLLTGDVGRDDSPNTFLSYNPDADAWGRLPLPPVEDAQLIAAGSKVVAIDGSDEGQPAVDAVYDPVTNRSDRLPGDPLGPSFDRSADWLGDRLLLSGSDLVPNPGADGPSVPKGRSELEATVGNVGDRTLVGGHLLQPQTLAWTRLPTAPWGAGYRTSQTIITGPDSVFVWGGADLETNLAEGYLLPL